MARRDPGRQWRSLRMATQSAGVQFPIVSGGQIPAIYFLALGSFAIGTEGFMVSGLLPVIAKDLSVSISGAGQLVTAFALAYAISSPVLAALLSGFDRRKLLLGALAFFTLANFLACVAPGFWSLLGARVLLAVAAGVYMPAATALAGSIVAPDRRGRALATVHGGITLALALGVPFGSLIGASLGWRATFMCVGVLAGIVTLGVARGLPASVSSTVPVATLAERLAVARRPEVLATLLVTMLWATGIWTIYPYLSPLLATGADVRGGMLAAVLLLYGVCAAIGVFISGRAIDRLGSRRVLLTGVLVLALIYMTLSFAARVLPPIWSTVVMVAAIGAWGVAGFTFNPAQQASLIDIAGLKVAPVSLSLNSSFVYLGFALGALLGSIVIAVDSVRDVAWVGALCEFLALGLMLLRPFYSASRIAQPTSPSMSIDPGGKPRA